MTALTSDTHRSPTPRIALVTGGARGLGLETGRQLAERGVHVILAARDAAAAETAATDLRHHGLSASSLRLDVTSEADRQAARAAIEAKHGRLDILVNNAGILLDSPDAALPPTHTPSTTPQQMLRDTFEANVFAPFFLIQTLLPLLRRSDAPRIVNVSSNRGSLALLSDPASPVYSPRMLAYDSSKVALNALTVLLAEELRGTRVKVNAVHPRWVRTDMGGDAADLSIEEGARTAVRYATLPDDGPTGGFFHLAERLPW